MTNSRVAGTPHGREASHVGAIHVVELAVPTVDDLRAATDGQGTLRASWVFSGIKDAIRAEHLDLFGHTDFVTSEASSIARFPLQEYRHLRYLVALSTAPVGVLGTSSIGLPLLPTVALPDAPVGDPGAVLGYVLALASKTDNTHLLELDGAIRPDRTDSGADAALWLQTLRLATELDRRTVITYQSQRFDELQESSDLVPPTNFGRLHRDRAVSVQLARGFELQQCERLSMMTVPPDPLIDGWISAARLKAGNGYTCTTWHGATPEHLLDDLAEMLRRMSIDVPTADLDYQEEVWTAERIRDRDAEIAAGGHVDVTTLIRDAQDRPVSFSVLEIPLDGTGFAYQNDTLVHGDHRGRRLGLLAKAVNLKALKAFRPDVHRIHTWNAGENHHMLAINDEMGFRPTGWEGSWQFRIPTHHSTD